LPCRTQKKRGKEEAVLPMSWRVPGTQTQTPKSGWLHPLLGEQCCI
jgi:hypothetical protein